MAINIIVGCITLFLIASVAVWLLWPGCRSWIEAPKYQPLHWDK